MTTTGRDPRLSQDQKKRISAVRNIGNGGWRQLFLKDGAIAKIIALVEADHVGGGTLTTLPDGSRPNRPLFDIPMAWFYEHLEVDDIVEIYLEAEAKIPDFSVLFESMSEIVKRRTRVQVIISSQRFIEPKQIAHRAVLERGIVPDNALRSQMMWRKMLYDIDNRVSAEAGYLNEAIFANALGGSSYASSVSPVLRKGDGSGRQIDCIVDDVAYEIKSRVTDAASGRARMADEEALPGDCRDSGYTPILLVFDDTPGAHRARLEAAYAEAGGTAYFGTEAWAHILQGAGAPMTRLLETYFRTSREICIEHPDLPLDMTLKAREDRIMLTFSDPETARDYQAEIPRGAQVA